MSCIVLIGGGIGCGKTTFINYLLKNKSELLGLHICPDDVYKAYGINEESLFVNYYVIQFDKLCSIKEQEQLMKTLRGWRDFRVDLLMAAERFITLACGSENAIVGPLTQRSHKLFEKLSTINNFYNKHVSNSIVLVEDNFYYRSMRYDWFQIARRTNIGFATVFLHCPLSIAVYRNSTRGYHIPEDRIKKMLSFLEYPDPVKYKWEKYSVRFDSTPEFTNSALICVVDVIKEAKKYPAELVISEDKIEAQNICSKNAIHQADKILRRIVSKKISSLKAINTEEDAFRTVVPFLIEVRQKLLIDIKHGVADLPEDLIDRLHNLGVESVLDAYEECLNKLFSMTLEEKSLDVNINNLCIEG